MQAQQLALTLLELEPRIVLGVHAGEPALEMDELAERVVPFLNQSAKTSRGKSSSGASRMAWRKASSRVMLGPRFQGRGEVCVRLSSLTGSGSKA